MASEHDIFNESDVGTSSAADPMYRIERLPSANKELVKVKPDSDLAEAITLMLLHDFSQLPVMSTEREIKGVISWKSIGSRVMLGSPCAKVRDCMERAQEVSAHASLFSAIRPIVEHEYVLVRNSNKKITGIVTVSDIGLQFLKLGEPFLLIGEIENHIRHVIGNKFTCDELQTLCNPSDKDRVVQNVSDLTFGEYVRIFENPNFWARLQLMIDRKTFVDHLDHIRQIRNDVMHFDPRGLDDECLEMLRAFRQFLQNLCEIKKPQSSS